MAASDDSERPRVVRHGDQPIPDPEIDRLLRWACEHEGQHQPSRDLADETLARLESGDAPRTVGEWLLGALSERYGAPPPWLSFLLDMPPVSFPQREDMLRRPDGLERRDGSSEAVRKARRFLLEEPDDPFRDE